jgi:hypothetical protein
VIVTDRLVFLHLHKSGGTFVNDFLLRFFPDARQIGYHLPRAHLPDLALGLPIFGLVRNPWDYYVSWYSFQAEKTQPNALFRVTSHDRRLGFAGTVANLVNLSGNLEHFSAIEGQLPERFINRGINLTQQCFSPLYGSGLGFYSFLYRRMFGDGEGVTFGRMESLRTDLLAFLDAVGITPTDAMREFVLKAAPVNTSRHEKYQRYYDAALHRLVAERDREVIERFNYEF